MRLIACHVENFGKLSDLSIEFDEGLNVINEANAWGKSTLAAFLKAMFYGLDSKKEAGAFEKERVLYRPWQGGAFGGEVDFELNGKRYRISRTFGKTEKTDEFRLYDLRTNLECFDFTEEIGLELFDLDSASFKRSIYIAQNDCATETSDRMNAKLGNLAEATGDISNFELATRRMKEVLNQLTPDRVTGSIKRRKGEITHLTQEVHSYQAATKGMEAVLEKEKIVSSQIQELLEIRKSYGSALVLASEDSRRKELYAQYDALCLEVNEKEEKVNSYKEYFPVEVPSAEAFNEQMNALRSMDETKATIRGYELTLEEYEVYSQLGEMFEKEVPEESSIDFSLETLTASERQKEEIARQEARLSYIEKAMSANVPAPKGKGIIPGIIILILGTLFTAAMVGLYLAVLNNIITFAGAEQYSKIFMVVIPVGILIMFMGLVLLIGGIRSKNAAKKRLVHEYTLLHAEYDDLKAKIEAMKADVQKVNSTIGSFLSRFHVYSTINDYQSKLYELKNQSKEYVRLTKKLKGNTDEKENYKGLRQSVVEFATRYGISLGEDMAADITLLQTKAMEYQHAKAAYNEALYKKEVFEKDKDQSFWARTALCPYSIDELNQMIVRADEKLEELKAAKAQYNKQLEDFQAQLDICDEKKMELEELKELQEKDIRSYELIKLTHDFMQRAKEQFTARYMAPIARGFSKYYEMLTGDAEGKWMIDANMDLKVREYGELRETKWLSAGYQDLIGVCMRLALVDAMYEEEKPFLILDDPFVNLDKEKVEYGNQLLVSVAEEYQVIYFTCHDSRCPK